VRASLRRCSRLRTPVPKAVTFEKRARALEQMFAETTEARPIGPDPDWVAIMDELSALKSSRAERYRGGVRIEPEDIPARILGSDYTPEELRELAILRALEKRGKSPVEIAELIPVWVERFEHFDRLRAQTPGDPHSKKGK
jgi:hypothetical protein